MAIISVVLQFQPEVVIIPIIDVMEHKGFMPAEQSSYFRTMRRLLTLERAVLTVNPSQDHPYKYSVGCFTRRPSNAPVLPV